MNSVTFVEGKRFFIDGTQTIATAADLEGNKIVPAMTILIDGSTGGSSEGWAWAFIASPVVENIAPTAVDNLVGNVIPETNPVEYDFDLYRLNPASVVWENYNDPAYHDGFNLVNGQGYLNTTMGTKTLVFHGTYNTGTEMEIENLPQGFNLLGNPFVVDAYANRTYYKMNAAGDDIEIVENYAENPIPACTGVVVKAETAGESVTFSTEVPQPSANNGNLQMTLINSGAKSDPFQDKAILSFNESDKLEKFIFNERRAKLYIPQNGNDYAIAYSESQGEVPLNFEAKENGEFSLTVNPEGVDMLYLHLIDNMTAADIDLLQTPTYTFTAKTSNYASRFRLIYAAQFSVGDEETDPPFAFNSNGNWIIPNDGEATLQVIDLNGRILSSETINGCVSKAINAAAGLYILRLINGKEVRTQKIVVR